jgi:hypothetical protein
VAVYGEHADAEHGGDALSDEAGSFEAVAQARVDRSQVVAELPADSGQTDRAAVDAVEQRGTQAAFLPADRLADAGLGDVQPLGGPAEVQFLGQGQEDLDVPQLHPISSRLITATL